MNTINVLFPMSRDTGYGLDARDKITALIDAGYDVALQPYRRDCAPENWVLGRLKRITERTAGCFDLIIAPPDRIVPIKRDTVYCTTLESTDPGGLAIRNLSLAGHVIVPSRWNKDSLEKAGMKTPVHVCPQGVDLNIFKPPPNRCWRDSLVFGAAGNSMNGSAGRKGLDTVIKAFQTAFPVERNVLLAIKDHPGSSLVTFDSRISVHMDRWSQAEMVSWYGSIDAFVSASSGEAWGRMLLEAMACGTPCIACDYGGHSEFFTGACGLVVQWTCAAAAAPWHGCWCRPEMDSLVQAMRTIYENRRGYPKPFRPGLDAASRFSNERAAELFLQTLQNIGAVSRIPADLV